MPDLIVNPESNETVCDFLRRVRSIVRDPTTAEALCPRDHFYGTKRPCIDSNYYETFNLPHVRLVDLRQDPLARVTEQGIDTASRSFQFDAIVYTTGFDAMTGAIVAVDIKAATALRSRNMGQRTADLSWAYHRGLPQSFSSPGPRRPSQVLSNVVVSIEQHVDWVGNCLSFMRDRALDVVEPTPLAQAAWVQHVNDYADITLFPRAHSWYMGANVPGKPRVFLPYIGGVDRYRQACRAWCSEELPGIQVQGSAGVRCHDGVIRPLQPDVALLLEAMAQMNLPPAKPCPPRMPRARW